MTQAPEPPIQSPAGPPPPAGIPGRAPALPPLSGRGVGGDRGRHFVRAVGCLLRRRQVLRARPALSPPPPWDVRSRRASRAGGCPGAAVGGVRRRSVPPG